MFNGTLERAILETLAYSDIFEYPLCLDEIHRYLPLRAEGSQIAQSLSLFHEHIRERDGFYFLAGREKNLESRRGRESHSQKLLPHALKYGRILGSLPFVRMVALTGSLAVMNSSRDADFDYLLVAENGRVWTARAFALLFNRITRLFGHTLCPNIIISEGALEWPQQGLYSARELSQMIPITGLDVYWKLIESNEWVKDFLPNAFLSRQEDRRSMKQTPSLNGRLLHRSLLLPPALAEGLLRGKLGTWFEKWEMDRKIVRFSRQEGFGSETIFNAEMCKGNFDHHCQWTQKAFEDRLLTLARIGT